MMRASAKRGLIYLIPVVIALMVIPILTANRHRPNRYAAPRRDASDTLRCIVALTDGQGLAEGFHYALLRRFFEDSDREALIASGDVRASWADSLRRSKVDLVVVHDSDSIDKKELMNSRSYEGNTIWLMRSADRSAIRAANSWITEMVNSEYYADSRKIFLRKRKSGRFSISPYDEIIKKYSEDIGWDWRLVASLIYHESRFSIEAESVKGAVGLMQVMPRVYSVDTLLNPETNIYLGTKHLKNLEKLFKDSSADSTECIKFCLAAYNGGEGRIQKYMHYAATQNVDSTRWDSVIAAAKSMEGFSGGTIRRYVNSVLNTYYDYTRYYSK